MTKLSELNLSLNELAIIGTVGAIFDRYDKSKQGTLNKLETFSFIQDTMGNLSTGEDVSDDLFQELFSALD